jgi:acyl-coenzyme A thioesterase PaaI-like protein
MSNPIFQDHYPEDYAHCYGCGYLNEHGLHIKSCWEGEEAVCRFTPRDNQTAFPGFVYGGLIASIIDCHSMGTAAAAWMRENGMEIGREPTERFVTGRLEVDYLRPTPMCGELEARSRAEEVAEKKVIVTTELRAEGEVCARGRVVAVRLPESIHRVLMAKKP